MITVQSVSFTAIEKTDSKSEKKLAKYSTYLGNYKKSSLWIKNNPQTK